MIFKREQARNIKLGGLTWVAISALIFVNLAWVLRWFYLDGDIPRFDGSWHLLQSWNDYLKIKQSGVWSYLESSISNRSVYFFSTTVVSWLLVLSQGQWRLSIGLFMSTCYALACSYLYLQLRGRMGVWMAVICSSFMMLSTVVLDLSCQFEGYVPFLAFGLAAAYHFGKTENWKQSAHSLLFGLYLIVAFSMRPFECFVLFSIPIAINTYQGLMRRHLKIEEVAVLVGLALIGLGSAVLNYKYTLYPDWKQSLIYCTLVLASTGMLVFLRRATFYTMAIAPFLFWVGFWFLSNSTNFLRFAYEFSFNPWLKEINGPEKVGGLSALNYLLQEYGRIPILVLVSLFLIKLLEVLVCGRIHRHYPKAQDLGFVLGAIVFFIIGLCSNTSEPYYYLGAVTVLGVLGISFLLSSPTLLSRFYQLSLFALTLIQVMFQWNLSPSLFSKEGLLYGWSSRTMIPVSSSASSEIVRQAATHFAKASSLRIAVLTQRPSYDDSEPPLVSLPGILLSLRLANPGWTGIFRLQNSGITSESDHLVGFVENCDYILVGPVDGRPEPRKRDLKLLPGWILGLVQRSEYDQFGLRLVAYPSVTDEFGHYVKYVLLERKN